MSFSFGFSGDDIDDVSPAGSPVPVSAPTIEKPQAGAFPVEGKPQLPPQVHSLSSLIDALPSKIAYSTLSIPLDDGGVVEVPRRELWDVRVQLMAEDDEGEGNATEGLGTHDVKTGVYEGGFKSWESSVDLIKVLAGERYGIVGAGEGKVRRVMELGCGTALPTLAIFQRALHQHSLCTSTPLTLLVADYNPSVLSLVTLPNLLLTWALSRRSLEPALCDPDPDVWSIPGELELPESVRVAFRKTLEDARIQLVFLSGGWSEEFVQLVYREVPVEAGVEEVPTVLMGAETIYSPFALKAFAATQFNILNREKGALALVAAKRHYFGVGGSLDDLISKTRDEGAVVEWLREENEGVRRGVVECKLA